MHAYARNIIQETLSQFEAAFVDEHTGSTQTVTFWSGEPIIYHAPHLAKPSLTHIDTIAADYFVAGCSCTARMVPIAQAQRVLRLKLSMEDVERVVNGNEVYAGVMTGYLQAGRHQSWVVSVLLFLACCSDV